MQCLKFQLQQQILQIPLLLFDCLGLSACVGGFLAESETKNIPRFCNLCQDSGMQYYKTDEYYSWNIPISQKQTCVLCVLIPLKVVYYEGESLPLSQAKAFETAPRRCPLMVQPILPNWDHSVCPEFGEFDKIAVFNHFDFIDVCPPLVLLQHKNAIFSAL